MSSELTKIDDFTQLFIGDTPLIDTRAPIEFDQGAFPFTQSLPLMSDSERELIGTCYKNKGQEQAVALGHELVQGEIKQARLDAWLEFIKNNPNGALYCFRGGMRSQITQEWIYEASGINYPRIKGGYKALRRFLIDETDRIMGQVTPIVIGGQTGCGKTLLLDQLKETFQFLSKKLFHGWNRSQALQTTDHHRHRHHSPKSIGEKRTRRLQQAERCQEPQPALHCHNKKKGPYAIG